MKFLFFSSLFFLLTTGAFAKEEHRLSVNGTATLYKPADQLKLTMGIETFDKNAQQAISANSKKMNAVVAALQKKGLSAKEIQTKDYIIIPQQTPAPQKPPADWHPSIAGYQVRNTLEIRTSRLDLAGELIDAVGQEGANYIESISYFLIDEESARVEAIIQAFHHAEAYAKAAVRDAGVKLGEILDITVNHPYVNAGMLKAARSSDSHETTPISPRDVEVTASISLIYAIESYGLQNNK